MTPGCATRWESARGVDGNGGVHAFCHADLYEGIADTFVQLFCLQGPGLIASVYYVRIFQHRSPDGNEMSPAASSEDFCPEGEVFRQLLRGAD